MEGVLVAVVVHIRNIQFLVVHHRYRHYTGGKHMLCAPHAALEHMYFYYRSSILRHYFSLFSELGGLKLFHI
jgi:hypothetical protein